MRLPQDKDRFVDWRVSKKLLPGSLVVLSNDGFQTLHIALLKNSNSKERNETHKKYGYISIIVEILKPLIENYEEFIIEHKVGSF